MKKKDKVFLPQLIGLIVLVAVTTIKKFLWSMPDYVFLPVAIGSLVSMFVGVTINFRRR